MEEGIVAGGGVALLRSAAEVDRLQLSDDEAVGANIVKKALQEPTRCIASNSGVDASVILPHLGEMEEEFGFNALTGQLEDLVAAGIVDPASTVCSALQSAASVAGMLLTTHAAVAEAPEE